MRRPLALLISTYSLCQCHEESSARVDLLSKREEDADDDCTALLQGSQDLLRQVSSTRLEHGPKPDVVSARANQLSQKQINSTVIPPEVTLQAGQFNGVYIAAGVMLFTMLLLSLVKSCSDGEFARLIPIFHLFGFGVSFTGFLFAVCGQRIILDTFHQMETQGKSKINIYSMFSWSMVSFVLMLVVNTIVVAYGLVGNGCIRESIFGNTKHYILQWMFGRGVMIFFRLVLWLIIWVHLLFSYVYLLLVVFMCLLGTMCGSGVSALGSLNMFLAFTGQGTIDTQAVLSYCSTTNNTSQAALLLWVGCVATLVGQIMILSALATEQERISQEMEHTWK